MRLEIQLALVCFFVATAVESRYERIGFVSDPVKLLLQDSYSSLKNYRIHNTSPLGKSTFRQIRKRKYMAFPPTFYSSFGFGALPFNSRRQMSLPYNDLLFSGR